MINHLDASWPEYNELFAHPFQWSWTRPDFHQWIKKKKDKIPCNTSATAH
jgi:hypothetical protein